MSEQATHHFAPEATSAAAARRFVRQTLTGWGADAVVDDALLLANELVTNALVHAGTEVHVSCVLGPAYVQIGVSDRHGSRTLPTRVANSAPDKTSGRGLYLLTQIAHTWGVEYDRASKRVWFRLPLPAAAPSPPPGVPQEPAQLVDLGETRAPIRVAVVETDTDGVVRDWSDEARNLLGWEAADVVGRQLADLVSEVPADPDSGRTGSFADVLRQPRWWGDYRVRTARAVDAEVFASHVHAHIGAEPRVVILLVPAQQRAVLVPPSAGAGAGQEASAPVPSRPGLLPLETLLDLAVEHSRDLLDGDVAYALLVSDDDLEVELRAAAGLDRAQVPQTRWPKPRELSGTTTSAQPAVYRDLGTETLPELFLADAGMRGLATAPMQVGDRVIGRIGVAVRRAGGLTADDAARLQRNVARFSIAVESARLNEVERLRRGRLSYLAEASDLLAGTLDPDMAASLTAQLVVPRLADWCAVYLVDQRQTVRMSCVWHLHEDLIDPLRRLLSSVPLPALDLSGRPRQWPELRERVAPHASSPADIELAGGPAMTVTLLARGRAIGVLIAGRGAGRQMRSGAVDTLDDLCRRAAWALDNARLYVERSATSHALQRSLLPGRLPQIPGLDVGVAYQAAGEGIEVGGDFYDLFTIDAHRWGFVVGDVCGKGAEAAAVTGLARHTLRVLAREQHDVPTVLRRLNDTILAEGQAARFVTLVYGEAVVGASSLSLRFAAAGHPLPTLVDRDGTLRVVGSAQPLLGVFPDPAFHVDTVEVARGQHLVLTTDGVTDRRVGRRTLGDQGLHALLRQTCTLPAEAVAARLGQAVLGFGSEPLQDDFAVLVLEPVGLLD